MSTLKRFTESGPDCAEAQGLSRAELVAELEAMRLLHELSGQLIQANCVETLYRRILEAAVAIMKSDFGSMQMLYPKRGTAGELKLLTFHGFPAEAARHWEWVGTRSKCSCATALQTARRCVVPDIGECEIMRGSPDAAAYMQAGIRSVQSTPLISRSGRIVGMISTHWRQPHHPKDLPLRLLDILARQATDLIERTQAENIVRLHENRFRSLVSVISDVSWISDGHGTFAIHQPAWESYTGQTWDQMRGFGWIEAVHPEDRDLFRKRWDLARRNSRFFESRSRLWRESSRQFRQVLTRAAAVVGESGCVEEWIGACTEVESGAPALERLTPGRVDRETIP